jgi:hypothetical protein
MLKIDARISAIAGKRNIKLAKAIGSVNAVKAISI